MFAPRSNLALARLGVVLALVALVVFGALRYEGFVSAFNILSFLKYNSMFALIALGMAFVIMTGGIDLSVGATAALASVAAALLSHYGAVAGILGGLGAGLAVGLVNGVVITGLRVQPFIATLATMLAASGSALLLAGNQSVSISTDNAFMAIGLNNFLGLPIPAWIALVAYVLGWLALERLPVGRRILAIGDGEATAKLMGLKVERTLLGVYLFSGLMAGTAGMVLAASNFAGQPTEGVGWELIAIASVVVGGTLLTGGVGSVGATLAGALLLGLVFTVINFENGKGWISLSSSWQPVIRGLFLLAVVILQAKLAGTRRAG
ncbi:MAG TPA: ABC transporter permease [Mesorhizobium sp.]|nr:ABC transporter permease [Mesorhizobium sp.]